MVDYVKMQAVAKRLIDENGRAIQVIVPGAEVDPLKPWEGKVDNPVPVDTIGVFTEYKRTELGDKIQSGDKRLVIAAENLGIDIQNADAVVDGAIRWQVVDTRVVQPGPLVLIYELQVRA